MTCRISNSDATGRQSSAAAVIAFAAEPAVGSVAGGFESEIGTRVSARDIPARGVAPHLDDPKTLILRALAIRTPRQAARQRSSDGGQQMVGTIEELSSLSIGDPQIDVSSCSADYYRRHVSFEDR
jgi:hypothetical protein